MNADINTTAAITTTRGGGEGEEKRLLELLSRPLALAPGPLSHLVTEWAAILSLPPGFRRPDLLARITHALLAALRAPERPADDDFTHESAVKYVLSELLDFALSVEADYALRSGPTPPPPHPDPVVHMSTYAISSHAVPPSRVLAQCRPRVIHAIAAWRKCMGVPTARPSPPTSSSSSCLMSFLDDGSGEAVLARPLGVPVHSLRSPKEDADRAAQAAANRSEFCALVNALLPLAPGAKGCDYLRRQLMLMTSHDAPIMSCEQYLDALPKLPMSDRDLFARSLFAQNPVLLDLIVLCAENAPRSANSTPQEGTSLAATTSGVMVVVTSSMALPPLSHTLFSLLASAAAMWSAPGKPSTELLERTEKVLLALRLCGYLPDPLGRLGEVLGAVPQKAVAAVLKEYLVFVLGSSAEKVSKTDVHVKLSERAYAGCRTAMAAAMSAVLEKVSQQFMAFFGGKNY